MEPLSIVVISAAAGGFAGKFVEKAWDSGEKWIQSFFKDHKEKALAKATENSMDFLNELAQRVRKLELSKQVTQEKIDTAQDHPVFSALLQKALITSSQTDSKNKHIILARLVSERLKSDPESILALGSKMACDVISYITVNQLMLLGLSVNFYLIRPIPFPPKLLPKEEFQNWMDNWLTQRLNPYKTIGIRDLDIIHLESLSCLKRSTFVGREVNKMFSKNDYKFDFNLMKDVSIKNKIKDLWDNSGFQQIDLTTVGQIIGVSVSDILTNTTTDFLGWD